MLWTISDLHLSGVNPKPMDIFGDRWRDHPARIASAWRQLVGLDDTVLIAGDISWALKLEDALVDLAWIAALPGRKIISRGNHDYWWSSGRVNRVRRALPASIHLIEGDALDLGDVVVCGTRGWTAPEHQGYSASADLAFYEREVVRLDNALAAGQQLAAGTRPLVVMIHFPPFAGRKPTAFARSITAAGATACVYGHLHRPEDWAAAFQGRAADTYFQLTSCDHLGFTPVAVRGVGGAWPRQP